MGDIDDSFNVIDPDTRPTARALTRAARALSEMYD